MFNVFPELWGHLVAYSQFIHQLFVISWSTSLLTWILFYLEDAIFRGCRGKLPKLGLNDTIYPFGASPNRLHATWPWMHPTLSRSAYVFDRYLNSLLLAHYPSSSIHTPASHRFSVLPRQQVSWAVPYCITWSLTRQPGFIFISPAPRRFQWWLPLQ